MALVLESHGQVDGALRGIVGVVRVPPWPRNDLEFRAGGGRARARCHLVAQSASVAIERGDAREKPPSREQILFDTGLEAGERTTDRLGGVETCSIELELLHTAGRLRTRVRVDDRAQYRDRWHVHAVRLPDSVIEPALTVLREDDDGPLAAPADSDRRTADSPSTCVHD